MDFTGKPLKGFLYIEPRGFATETGLSQWLTVAVELAGSLPAKQAARTRAHFPGKDFMVHLSSHEFDEIATRAIDRIPEELRGYLENIVISVQPRPSDELLEEMGMDPEEDTLLGLYQGVALTERSATDPPMYPDTIFLFQEPIEEMCDSVEEIEDEIEITVVHEVAHFFGIDEERLAELGYD